MLRKKSIKKLDVLADETIHRFFHNVYNRMLEFSLIFPEKELREKNVHVLFGSQNRKGHESLAKLQHNEI